MRDSPDVLAAFKATGQGWQARMNDALREWLKAQPHAWALTDPNTPHQASPWTW
ncbi:MAG: BrnA antitoxin family protein [Rhodoferax sp.]|nr:BrnA antitoxin family protein [Rhodoferax sp.]MBJ7468939.1 BrnA antitoxin family protein [Rhodoferax sp.]